MDAQSPGQKTSFARKLALELAVGAILGFVGWSLGGPAVISLWYAPPSRDAFSCAGTVKEALSQFVTMQLVCAFAGGAVLALALFLIRRARKSNSPA
jgi:divalent metal cation (Fe/Co/Zn/Cd) transporter